MPPLKWFKRTVTLNYKVLSRFSRISRFVIPRHSSYFRLSKLINSSIFARLRQNERDFFYKIHLLALPPRAGKRSPM